jgi:hypothetical protein
MLCNDRCRLFVAVCWRAWTGKRFFLRNHLNLSIPHRENRVQIIDVGENKVQVSDPARAPQEIDAPAA